MDFKEANVAELDSSPKNLGKSIELDTIYSKNGRKSITYLLCQFGLFFTQVEKVILHFKPNVGD
jgi:hypothetical protein